MFLYLDGNVFQMKANAYENLNILEYVYEVATKIVMNLFIIHRRGGWIETRTYKKVNEKYLIYHQLT